MTENSRKVFNKLKEAGVGVAFTTKKMQKELGLEKAGSVTGSVQGLYKKGYVEKFDKTVEVTDEDGNVKEKVVKAFAITEAGMNYDPDAEIAK